MYLRLFLIRYYVLHQLLQYFQLQQQGLSFELYEQFTGKNKDAIKADLTDQAKDRVKLNLILAAIVEAENIEVTDEERNSELDTIANTYFERRFV